MATTTESNGKDADVEIVFDDNKEKSERDTSNDKHKKTNSKSDVIGSLETESNKNTSSTIEKIQLLLKHYPQYFVLGLSIFSLVMSVIILLGVYGSLKSKMSAKQQAYNDALRSKMHYEGTDIMDEAQTIYVGNYYGWSYASYRKASYRSSKNDYQGGNDQQYPLPDLRVRYGDKLIFKRYSEDASLKDNLLLVNEALLKSCDFSKYTNSDGEIPDSSEILLASEKDLYSEDGTVEYVIDVNSSLPNTLLFTSSYKWDAKNGGSCSGGLKLKVIVDRTYRDLMPVRRSSDKWRGISSTETVINLDASIGHVARQLTLQHFSHEQRIRSNGHSGVTNVRGLYDGEAYDDGTYTNYGSGSIHDHSDNLRVIGIGEIEAVLNGVEFQTKHIDYYLNMPSKTSSEYDHTEVIQFPDVPGAVTKAGSVENQIEEMQKWFLAWKDQDASERNYTKYFKPILCYLEGTWILSSDDLFDHIDNNNDLLRWFSNNGRQSPNESLSHVPSSIRNMVNNTYPIISNWDYRVVCHPLKNDVSTSRMRLMHDLSIQLYGSPKTMNELYFDKKARFDLNKYINLDDINNDNQWTTSRYQWNYLDYLMEQIPGKDNYIASVTDELPDGSGPILRYGSDEWINSGYYSRYYKLSEGDAMGSTGHRRSYGDRNLFCAKTTQLNVSPIQMNFEVQNETTGESTYYPTISRWSYALPLEIIYLTPLTKWNPYNIKEKKMNDFDYNKNGKCTSSDAYNGFTSDKAYFTPSDFYVESNRDNICAMDSSGNMRNVEASGHYINMPEIGGGIGKIRQRYPIFPVHNEGSSEFKELKALQAVALSDDYETNENIFGENKDLIYGIIINLNGAGHSHSIYIPPYKVRNKWYDSTNQQWLSSIDNIVEVESSEMNNHQHTLKIWREKNSNNQWEYHLARCRYGTLFDNINDWNDNECSDYHNQISV